MKDQVKQLVEEADLMDPQDDIAWEINRQKRIDLLTINLDQTIEYLDNCSEKELWWNTDSLEEIMEHFMSEELIACVERNIKRCKNPDAIDSLNQELGFIKDMLE